MEGPLLISKQVEERLSDSERLRVLDRTALLDSPPEDAFDRITRLAGRLVKAPVTLVSLLDADRQFVKSGEGLPEPWATLRQFPLSHSICKHVVATGEPLIVANTLDHDLLKHHAATHDLNVRAYLGIPLHTPENQTIGSFCAIGDTPREWTEDDIRTLTDLANLVMTEVALRLELKHQKEVEAELRDSGALMSSVLNAALDCIITFDEDGCILDFNPAAEATFGYAAEDIKGRELADVVFPERYRAAHREGLERYLRDGADPAMNTRAEIEAMRANGARFPAELTVTPSHLDDGRRVFTAYLRDITERNAAREALEKSEARYRSVVEGVRDIVFHLDDHGVFSYLNEAWCTVTGFDPDASIGRRVDAFFPRDEAYPSVFAALHAHAVSGEAYLLRAETAEGRFKWLEVRPRLQQRDGVDGIGITGTISDVTDLFRIEAERAARAQAESLLELKNSILGNMSHEIRTPMAAIIGCAEMLHAEVEPGQQEFVEMIIEGGERLQRTLDSLLLYSQVESGSVALHADRCSIAREAEAVAAFFRPRTPNVDITVEVAGADAEGTAHTDVSAVRCMLANLIENAVKFTSEGTVTVIVDATGDSVRVRVSDTGIGIAPDVFPRLFKAFEQGSSGLSRSFEGCGLGLAISRRYAEMLGGTLTAESEVGVGSTFTLTLPKVMPNAAQEALPAGSAKS